MHQAQHVRVYYCTVEVRSLMVELPMEGLLRQGAKTLSPGEFAHLEERMSAGQVARIEGPDCWFEYVSVRADAA